MRVQQADGSVRDEVQLMGSYVTEDGQRLKIDLGGATLEGVTLGDQKAATIAHSFHDAATVAADGAPFDVLAYKTLTVEIYGTSTSRTVVFIGIGPSGTQRPIMGVRLSDFSTGTSTTGTGEFWQFDITGLSQVIMDLTAVSGGNVSVKGKAVA